MNSTIYSRKNNW